MRQKIFVPICEECGAAIHDHECDCNFVDTYDFEFDIDVEPDNFDEEIEECLRLIGL